MPETKENAAVETPNPVTVVSTVNTEGGESCGITNNITVTEPADEPVNRARRSYYIFAVTAFSLVMASVVVLIGMDSKIAEHFSLGLLDLVEILAIIYVSAGVIDRGKILNKVGEAIELRFGKPNRRRENSND